MRFFHDLPIKRKLVLVTLVTCCIALALACSALFWFQSVNFRKGFAAELESLGAVIAHNSSAPLTFQDKKSAGEVLSALKVKPHITGAYIFDSEGKLFAFFGEEAAGKPAAVSKETAFAGGFADLTLAIDDGTMRLGTLHLHARFADQYNELLSLYGAVLASVVAGSLLIILLLSSLMQRIIAGPITALADVAHAIAEKEDYTVRAPVRGKDEVGLLTTTFNRMLDQIQAREAALEQAHAQLASQLESLHEKNLMMENAVEGIAVLDARQHYLSVNRACAGMLGRTPDELIGCHSNDIIHRDDLSRAAAAYETMQRDGKVTLELRAVRKDGSIFHKEVTMIAHLGSEGQLRGHHRFMKDITARKEAEEREKQRGECAFRQQSTLLRLSQLDSGNFDGHIATILRESAQLLGVERASFWWLRDEPARIECEHLYRLSTDAFSKETTQLEASAYPKYFAALASATNVIASHDTLQDPMFDEFVPGYFEPLGITSMLDAPVSRNGHVLGVICFEHTGPKHKWTAEECDFARAIAQQVALVLESHERRRAEDSLRLSEQRYRSVVNSVKEVIFQADARGAWTFLNPAWTDITGFTIEQSVGRSSLDFVHSEDRAKAATLVQPLLDQKVEDARGELRFVTLAGEERWIEFVAHPTLDTGTRAGTGISGTLTDITERKRVEAELTRLNRELQDAARQAGMAEIATGVLHNVGNVLNSVNVSATLVVDGLRKSEAPSLALAVGLMREHHDHLGDFLSSDPKGRQLPAFLGALADELKEENSRLATEMQSLQQNIDHIKQIVARQQAYAKVSGIIENIPVRELVEDALNMAATGLARHQVKVIRDFANVPPVMTDRHKILQILINLLSNAKHALDHRPNDRQLTLRIGHSEGRRVKIEITDNGIGIPPENLARIFSHGFTTKKSGHGFGLHSGANAAKELGGSLTARSPGEGEGATFTLELPTTAAAQVPAAA